MEGGTTVRETLIVTAFILLFFAFFTVISYKAEKEVDRFSEERLKTAKKSR